MCLLPDAAETRELMTALHGRMARGTSPSEALAELSPAPLDAASSLVPACLTSFGV